MRAPFFLFFALAFLLSSCNSGTSEKEIEDMRQQVQNLEHSIVASETYLRDNAAFHQQWLLVHTDSSAGPAMFALFTRDSSFNARIRHQDYLFHHWFSHYAFLNRDMRMQVMDMQNWLSRLQIEGSSRVHSRRAFTSRLENYLLSSHEYRDVSSAYQVVKSGYSFVRPPG